MSFQQQDFTYHDLYSENSYLKETLQFYCKNEFLSPIDNDLKKFSTKASQEILSLMWQAEKDLPQLIQYDHWGKRIDHVEISEAWNKLHRISAEEKIVAIGYERKSQEYSRLHQFLKLMLFHPSSAFYSCPLAMTDGAARVLELESNPVFKDVFNHLISSDSNDFWTAGQWMTEKTGGSDVSLSETYAEMKNGRYYLYGTKWFTSAITAHVAMVLAQTEVNGVQKLSLFLVYLRNKNNELNSIEVLRLKDKLGTKAMPTAELKLCGTEGFLIGELGGGVKKITSLLNISRLYNSVCATGTLYRLHSLLRDYSEKRMAFGQKLKNHPLHATTLTQTQATTLACVHMVCDLSVLLGKSETGKATDQEQSVLRFFTPIAKAFTAKKAIEGVSEMIEAFGGAGYIEDTQLPRFLRDAQVFSIWEGTTNIMSLDMLRALSKDSSFSDVSEYIKSILSSLKGENLKTSHQLLDRLEQMDQWYKKNKNTRENLEWGARDLLFYMAEIYCSALLLQFSLQTKSQRDQISSFVFVKNVLIKSVDFTEASHFKL